MPPLDAALQRLGRAALPLLDRPLAERVRRVAEEPAGLEDGEEYRVADEVDRLAGLLAKTGLPNSRIPIYSAP